MNPICEKSLRECVKELYGFLRSGLWDEAKPRHFAALHGWCHKRVYGAWPLGLDGREFSQAALRAGRLLRDAFFGDCYDMADYIRWCWLREREYAAKPRKLNARKGPRLNDESLFIQGKELSSYRKALVQRARTVERGMSL